MRFIRDEDGERIETGVFDFDGEQIIIASAEGFGGKDIFMQSGHMTWADLDKLKEAIAEAERLWRKS